MIIHIPEGTLDIRAYEFRNREDITAIVLPSTLTRIGISAFEGCTHLESIVIPNSVNLIRESAFKNCHRLKSVQLPEGLTQIEPHTFEGCRYLEDIIHTDQIRHIQEKAFRDCGRLLSIDLPQLEELGSRAFENTGLRSIALPDSVTDLPYDVFTDCTYLRNISLPAHLDMDMIRVQGFDLMHTISPVNPWITRRSAILPSDRNPNGFIERMQHASRSLNRKMAMFLSLCLKRSSLNTLPSEMRELILTFTEADLDVVPGRQGRMRDVDQYQRSTILAATAVAPTRSIDFKWAQSWDALDLDKKEAPSFWRRFGL